MTALSSRAPHPAPHESFGSIGETGEVPAPSDLRVPHKAIRLHRTLTAIAGVAAVLALAAALLIVDLRNRAIEGYKATLSAISLAMADQADRSLQAIEQVQIGLIEEMRTAGVHTTEDYARRMSSYAVFEMLRNRVSVLPQVNAVTMIDADGNLLNFSRYWPIPKVNLADRDYFKHLKADPSLDRVISPPIQNRGDGTWTVYLARAFRTEEGKFLGVVLGAIELRYFETLYRQVAPQPDAVVSMFRTDGVRLMRMPPATTTIGQVNDGTAVMGMLRSGLLHQTLRHKSTVDGRDRLVSIRRIAHYPIAIQISRTIEAVTAGWREQAVYLGTAALLLEAGLLWIAALVRRQAGSQLELLRVNAAISAEQKARASAESDAALALIREQGERALRTQYSRFALALGTMTQGVAMFDAKNRVVVSNPALAEMFGGGSIEQGLTLAAVLRGARQSGGLTFSETCKVWHRLRQLGTFSRPESEIWDIDDGRSFSLVFEPTNDRGWLLTCEDITERRAAEARIAHLAHHDMLTDLPNRLLFQEMLERAVAEARNGAMFAVLCLDLDRFKEVNDTLGHATGDALLRRVALRLQRCVRETDTLARLGGDEFAIIQSGLRVPLGAADLSRRVMEELSLPYDIDGQHIEAGASIGIALAPNDSTNAEELLKQADLALYQAKAEGGRSFCFFQPDMDKAAQARRQLELDLRRALIAEQFEVHYQPLVRATNHEIVGFEALLRWHHPERGPISPGEFIPASEELGLIVPIGAWVLQKACQEAATWPAQLKVAVNLSPIQVSSKGIFETVEAALAESGLSPGQLELEITEQAMLSDTEETLTILHRLRELGVTIAMDDFGSGNSSLNYLRRFPFDKVKIDRSFVQGLGTVSECTSIVRALVALCRELNMLTLAEGVETETQMAEVQRTACVEMQGFLFGRAVPPGAIPGLLARSQELSHA